MHNQRTVARKNNYAQLKNTHKYHAKVIIVIILIVPICLIAEQSGTFTQAMVDISGHFLLLTGSVRFYFSDDYLESEDSKEVTG